MTNTTKAVLAGAAFTGFAALAATFAGTEGASTWEQPVRDWLEVHAPSRTVREIVVPIGSAATVLAAGAGGLAAAVKLRRVDLAVFSVGAVATAAATDLIWKPLIARTKSGHLAFPSGHSAGAMCTAAICCSVIAAWPNLTNTTRGALRAGTIALATIGVAAPTIWGFHWPADTIGSVLWCSAGLLSAQIVADVAHRRYDRSAPTATTAAVPFERTPAAK